jgi:hypothetical protein
MVMQYKILVEPRICKNPACKKAFSLVSPTCEGQVFCSAGCRASYHHGRRREALKLLREKEAAKGYEEEA